MGPSISRRPEIPEAKVAGPDQTCSLAAQHRLGVVAGRGLRLRPRWRRLVLCGGSAAQLKPALDCAKERTTVFRAGAPNSGGRAGNAA